MRGLFGVLSFAFFSYACKLAPGAKVNLLFNINPLVILGLSYYFLKERITQLEYVLTFAAYFGVMFMCFSKFGKEDGSEVIITIEEEVPLISPLPNLYPEENKGLVLGLLAGICAGTAYAIV